MKNENNVKQSDWYIGKYGTQSEVIATSSETTNVKVPTFSMDISGVNSTKSVDVDFFKNKLIEKGITFSEAVEQITPHVREERVKPEGKGFTASFAEVVKTKLSEKIVDKTTNEPLTFEKKFIDNSGVSTPLESKSKKFFATIADNTPLLDATDFQDFVATIINLPRAAATSMIKNRDVTVNDLVVTDLNYVLKSGDVVRVGVIGHFIKNTEGAAIVN